MKKIKKIIKIIITILLALTVLLGIFYGFLITEEKSKESLKIVYVDAYEMPEYINKAKANGYYISPEILNQNNIQSYAYIVKAMGKQNKISYTENKISIEYGNSYFFNGIDGISVNISTNDKKTLYDKILYKKTIKDNHKDVDRFEYNKIKIGNSNSKVVTCIQKNNGKWYFVINCESIINDECTAKIVICWLIDINNYNYEELKQNAIDYVAYIIGNIQPPIY